MAAFHENSVISCLLSKINAGTAAWRLLLYTKKVEGSCHGFGFLSCETLPYKNLTRIFFSKKVVKMAKPFKTFKILKL